MNYLQTTLARISCSKVLSDRLLLELLELCNTSLPTESVGGKVYMRWISRLNCIQTTLARSNCSRPLSDRLRLQLEELCNTSLQHRSSSSFGTSHIKTTL